MKTIDIDLPANGYPVYVGRGLLAQGECWRRHLSENAYRDDRNARILEQALAAARQAAVLDPGAAPGAAAGPARASA